MSADAKTEELEALAESPDPLDGFLFQVRGKIVDEETIFRALRTAVLVGLRAGRGSHPLVERGITICHRQGRCTFGSEPPALGLLRWGGRGRTQDWTFLEARSEKGKQLLRSVEALNDPDALLERLLVGAEAVGYDSDLMARVAAPAHREGRSRLGDLAHDAALRGQLMRRLRADRIAPSSPTGSRERVLEFEERARRMRAPYGKRELAVPLALLDASD